MSTSSTIKYVSPGVIEITSATGEMTTLNFTSTGQIQKIQDGLGRSTQFTYDANDYLKQINTPNRMDNGQNI